jgi:hypothetical protein
LGKPILEIGAGSTYEVLIDARDQGRIIDICSFDSPSQELIIALPELVSALVNLFW